MNTTHVYILFYSYVGVNSILVYNEFGVAFIWLYFLHINGCYMQTETDSNYLNDTISYDVLLQLCSIA